jgi:hypothetical protein
VLQTSHVAGVHKKFEVKLQFFHDKVTYLRNSLPINIR